MKNNRLPSGVWPVMLTPFQEDGAIDWVAYDELIEFYLAGGVSGLFATCLSGEIPKLTKAECVSLAERTVQVVDGRVPVAAGAICQGDQKESVEYAKCMEQAGADVIVFAVNQFAGRNESESCLSRNLFDFADKIGSSMRFGLYECPYPYHRKMSPALVQDVCRIEQLIFLKDTTADIEILRQKIKKAEGSALQFYNANAPSLEASLQIGASGYAGIGANFFCEPFVKVCEGLPNDEAGDRIRELVVAVQRYAGKAEYPAVAKYFLQKHGLRILETCRVASVVTAEQRRELDKLWEQWQEVHDLLCTVA